MATVMSGPPRMRDRVMMNEDWIAIYSGAFIEGNVLVVFSAFTGDFVSKYHYALSLPRYGLLFIPLVLAVVLAALFSTVVSCRFRGSHSYIAGLSCNLAGLALLSATTWVPKLAISYPLLLASTALVGLGGGLIFPFLRCYAVAMQPLRARRQILRVNGLLAAGAAATPVYALLTASTRAWWSLPPLLGLLIIAEMVLSRSLRTPPEGAPARRQDWLVPAGLRIYPGLALLYGACAVICITAPHHVTGNGSHIHLSLLVLGEVAFWAAMVQGFRVAFALIDGMRSWRRAASIGLFMIAALILVLSLAAGRYDVMHAGLYLLGAVGCAALLPIDARPGHERIALVPLAITCGIIALFPVGLGLSRYAADIVTRNGMTPLEEFLGIAVVGAAACLLLLPVIIKWRTLEYFEQPAGRNAGAQRLGYSCAAAMPSAQAEPGVPAPREPDVPGEGSGQGSAGRLDHHGPQRRFGRRGP